MAVQQATPEQEEANLNTMAQIREQRIVASKQKIVKLLRGYPRDAPSEFVLFGYGGVKINLGEMKDAFGIE